MSAPDTPDPAASALDRISAELRTFGASDEDTRRLLAAIEAALAFHEEFDGTCGSCCDAYGEAVAWPCEEFTDITAALTGKEAGDADPR